MTKKLDETLIKQLDIEKYIHLDYQNVNIVLPGDLITSTQGFMHGNGTFEEGGKIYSSLIGTVEKTNQLIIVNPLRSNYVPQVGDIIVGRIVEISNKRWKIDIESMNHASLHLNSTYLPQQRIKTEEDELNMRQILSENDLACAEVHSINNDKSVNLHTRSLKYGRLENGILINVHNKLIKRQKHHFVKLRCGVSLIFSHNGVLWLSNVERQGTIKEEIVKREYNLEDRENMSKICNIIKILNQEQVEILTDFIDEIYDVVVKQNLKAKQIIEKQHQQIIIQYLKELLEKKIPTILNKLTTQVDFFGSN